MYPTNQGPMAPDTNPEAVKTMPKILLKFYKPKQSLTSGVVTAFNVPNENPITAA